MPTPLANFMRMAVCFAVNHAAVVSVLSLANGLLGDNANYENGSLYLTYALTAMFASTGLIDYLGPRKSLVVSAARRGLASSSPGLARGARGSMARVRARATRRRSTRARRAAAQRARARARARALSFVSLG